MDAPAARVDDAHPWCRPGAAGPTGAATPLRITADSLGPLTVRIRRDALRRACPALRDTTVPGAEGEELPATVLTFLGRDVGVAEWAPSGELERAVLESSEVWSPSGLHVGSSVGDLRRTLGPLQGGFDDAGVYVWSAREPSVSYLLRSDARAALPSPDDVGDRLDVVPDTVRVRRVIYVRAP